MQIYNSPAFNSSGWLEILKISPFHIRYRLSGRFKWTKVGYLVKLKEMGAYFFDFQQVIPNSDGGFINNMNFY